MINFYPKLALWIGQWVNNLNETELDSGKHQVVIQGDMVER